MNYDNILERFDKLYKEKKFLNLAISAIIIVMGISSVIFIWNHDKDGILTFRWMTVDGTIFTTLMTIFYVVVNLIEITRKTELTRRPAYFARLSSAVAECVIFIVVMLSQIWGGEDALHILRYDMFCMHIAIPILTVASFVMNDSPQGKLNIRELLYGTLFVTVYAVVITWMIGFGYVTKEYIPYPFLDFENMTPLMIIACLIFVYGLAFGLGLGLSTLNRKLYWRWFRDLARE